MMELIQVKIGLYSEPLYVRFLQERPNIAVRAAPGALPENIKYALAFCDIVEDSGEDRDLKFGVLSLIHREMSSWYRMSNDLKSAHDELKLTIDFAVASGLSEALYAAYCYAGHLGYVALDHNAAIAGYQKALPYSHSIKPDGTASVLKSLGLIWGDDPETLPLAETMFSWWLTINPYSLEANELLSGVLQHRLGKSSLRSALKSVPKQSCENIAKHIGALASLGRHKAARKLALVGLQVSQELKDAKWESTFEKYLQ
jgi:hypothetical protein